MIRELKWITAKETDPFYNLSMEETLLRQVKDGECILYLWQNRNTVVIGRNQNAWGECRVEQLAEDGGVLARRLSGGGAVYHDLGNLNFTFLVREPDLDTAKQTSVLLRAVRSLGIEAELTGRNDLTVGGRKFSGHAWYKSQGSCFHHGTLMVDVDGEKLSRYLNVPAEKLTKNGVGSVRSRVINLVDLCPGLSVNTLSEKVVESFGEVYGLFPERLPEEQIDSRVLAACRERFSSWDWRFGAKLNFPEELNGTFPWGSIRLGYTVDRGRLRDVRLYSDGLEADLLSSIPFLLEGQPYTPAAIKAALAGRRESQSICDDIAELFRSAF